MHDVEAAIGEADAEPAALPAPHQGPGLGDAVVFGAVPLLVAHVARQFEHQFVELDRGGAELADRDPRGGVGEAHRLRQRMAAGAGQRQDRDHRVAGARDVEHLARPRPLDMHRARGLDQHHALFRAGGEDRGGVGLAHHLGRRRDDLAIGCRGHPRRGGQLLLIGGDAGGAAIAREIIALGIDIDRDAERARPRDRGGDDPGPERALGVIRQDHRIDLGEGAFDRGDQRGLFLLVEIVQALLVNTHDVLMSGDITGLADRRPPRARDMGVDETRRRCDQGADLVAARVMPQQPDQHGPAAQRDDVARDVANPAEHALGAQQQQHRHRRLGRDPLAGAIGEAIEHQIAKTQDRGVGKIHRR